MLRNLLSFLFIFLFTAIYAQVGVGTAAPDASAQLDVVTTNKGILIPRLDIVDLNTAAPVAAADIDVSLLAYNTNAASGKGFYYWDGTKWAPISNNETLTELALNSTVGTLTYTDEDGNDTVIDLSDLETLTKITSDINAGTITYTDEIGKETAYAENLVVAGTGTIGGAAITSDARLKTNIVKINNALEKVKQLRAVEYDKKDRLSSKEYDRHEIGFIAQEVEKVLPQVVSKGNNAYAEEVYSLDYNSLIPILTKAIQELETQNTELKERLAKIEAKLDL